MTQTLIIERVTDAGIVEIGRTRYAERAEQIRAAARRRIAKGSSEWIRVREV